MKEIKHAVVLIIVLAGIALSGCASTTQHTQTGFLSNYEQLKPSAEFDNANVYLAPGFNRHTLGEVAKIHIEPFEVWLPAQDAAMVSSDQLTDLILYFHSALNNALSKDYTIVDKASHDVLSIRGAFSAINIIQPELSPTDFIPFRIVLNAGNAAYLSMTEQQDLVTQVGIEVEFTLGNDASPVFAMTNVKTLDTTVSNSKTGNLEAVQRVLDTWIENFVKKLAQVRQSSN